MGRPGPGRGSAALGPEAPDAPDAPDAGGARGARGPLGRWLGPIAGLAASAEWVRWNSALRAGEPERAYTIAARALALDPTSPQGWSTLGQHLILDRSAAVMEPDRARRATWAKAGLDVLRQGEGRSRDPAALALIGGDLAAYLAERDDLDWPLGAPDLLDLAEAAYLRANAAGHPQAEGRIERIRAFRRAAGGAAGDAGTGDPARD
ncbi:MAG: hypothetical protein R3F49_14715 [Planctomycetota bacterium]